MRHSSCFLFFLLILFLFSCKKEDTAITSLSLLEGGKTFAVPTGTAADQFVLKKFPDAKLKYFNTVLDCAISVKTDKADAAVYDQPILKNIAAKNDGLVVLRELLFDDQYGFAVQLTNNELKTAIDEVLTELKSDGTYNDMMKRWFPDHGNPSPMPVIDFPGTNGTLVFGTAAVTEPMSFVDASHSVVGFDIEFATYIAKKLDKQLQVVDMEFGAMLPALIAGKVDMIGAGLSITEERAKNVLFSESYYPSGIAALVRGEAQAEVVGDGHLMRGAEDIKDKRMGVLLGSIHDSYVNKTYPEAKVYQYQNASDMLIALETEKVDVLWYDHFGLKEILSTNPDVAIIAENVFDAYIAAGFNSDNDALREQFNAYLKDLKANGTHDEMLHRWMNLGLDSMPDIPNPATVGTLKVGMVNDLGKPATYVKDGELAGFDVEIAERFAAYLGREFVPVPYQFSGLLAAVSTGKIDMIAASMMITEERDKQIDFSDPYHSSGASVIALKKYIWQQETLKFSSMEDLAGKRLGFFTGTVHDAFVAEHYPKAEPFRFDRTADMMLSLKTGKIDGALFDAVSARLILKHNPDLALLTDNLYNMPLGVGFSKKNPGLRKEFNKFLKEIRQDGTYDTIYKRWFLEDAEKADMPVFTDPVSNKKIMAGVSVEDLPYVAYMDGEYVGFDIEILEQFALRNNYQIEFTDIAFASLVPALAAGKVDLISDGIAISEERAQQIDFSDPYAEFKTAVLVAKKNLATTEAGIVEAQVERTPFFKSLSNSFHSNLLREKRYMLILNGLKVTIIISIFAALFGTLIGGGICYLRMSKRKILSAIASLFITLIRGTPVLVLLMIIFYIIFASVNINPVLVAVIAFGINFGAYVSEMFRTSIESVDKGQREAGIASGFTRFQTFIYIITPQALRTVLPVYKGEFISLVKMTSIVGYIAVQDLTKASDIIRSRTFDAFFPLIMAAVIYLVIAWLLTWGLSHVEISVDPKRKRIKKAGEELI
jgi:polar amino acid transport system substrate-binding protein